MSKEIRKQIDRFKKWKQFLNENTLPDFYNLRYIGYHCSDNPNLDKTVGCVNLGKNDYYEWHEGILESIKEKYPEAEEYIKLSNDGDTGFGGDDTTKISNFLNKIGICGVFIDEEKPNKRWGKYCYQVFFENIEFERIHDFIMAEEGEEWCFLYLHQNSKPIFKKISQSVNENYSKSKIYLSQNGVDGFGYVMNIHLQENGDKIGSIVFRQKTYLKEKGYPNVLELHIGFEENYQRMGFFQDALIELLNTMDTPIFISSGRIINPNVLKAVYKLNESLLNVKEIEHGFIITLK